MTHHQENLEQYKSYFVQSYYFRGTFIIFHEMALKIMNQERKSNAPLNKVKGLFFGQRQTSESSY